MPYIDQEQRYALDNGGLPKQIGELNYVVTRACDAFLMRTGVSYTNINQVIGVLECAKMELYRRIAAPYEDRKARDNGEVYVTASGL